MRFYAANITIVAFFAAVLYSGFAYPLRYGNGFWPFNAGWFMFSYDTGYDYELQAVGKMADGTEQILDVSPFFKMAVGSRGNRFQEAPREEKPMRKLAAYLCKHFQVQSITINDITWVRSAGPRLKLSEVSPGSLTYTPWVENFACGS